MDDLSIASLQKFMTSTELRMSETICDVSVPFDVKSVEYLKFAESDLGNSDAHNLINALSNIKRGIDCQIDSLLIAFGLYKKSKEENWHFPHKLSVLKELGVTSPRILNKINTKRNQLEHYYSSPKKEEVEDALDVATLFNAYTDKFLHNALIEAEIQNEDKMKSHSDETSKFCTIVYDAYDFIKIAIDYNKSILSLGTFSDKENKHFNIEIPITENDYINYLKIYIDCYRLR
jgi:hypothetical protein